MDSIDNMVLDILGKDSPVVEGMAVTEKANYGEEGSLLAFLKEDPPQPEGTAPPASAPQAPATKNSDIQALRRRKLQLDIDERTLKKRKLELEIMKLEKELGLE